MFCEVRMHESFLVGVLTLFKNLNFKFFFEFLKMSPKGPPSFFFWNFATNWSFTKPKGPLFLQFWASDIAPILAVPGLFISIAILDSCNAFDCVYAASETCLSFACFSRNFANFASIPLFHETVNSIVSFAITASIFEKYELKFSML